MDKTQLTDVAKWRRFIATEMLSVSPAANDIFAGRFMANMEDENATISDAGVTVDGNEVNMLGYMVPDALGFLGAMLYGAVVTPTAFKEALDSVEGDVTLRYRGMPGGIAEVGMQMGVMVDDRRESGSKVTSRVDVQAASAATLPMVRSDEVLIDEMGQIMIHYPRGVGRGTADEVAKSVQSLRSLGLGAENLYVDRRSLERSKVQEAMTQETIFTGQEAVDFGLADSLLKRKDAIMPANEAASMSAPSNAYVQMLQNLPVMDTNLLLATNRLTKE